MNRLNVTVCNRINCLTTLFTIKSDIDDAVAFLHMKKGRGQVLFLSNNDDSDDSDGNDGNQREAIDVEEGQIYPFDSATDQVQLSCQSAYHCMYVIWKKTVRTPGIWTAFNHQSIYSLLPSFSSSSSMTMAMMGLEKEELSYPVEVNENAEGENCFPLHLPSFYQSIELIPLHLTSFPFYSLDEDRNCLVGTSLFKQTAEYVVQVHTVDGKHYNQTIQPVLMGEHFINCMEMTYRE